MSPQGLGWRPTGTMALGVVRPHLGIPTDVRRSPRVHLPQPGLFLLLLGRRFIGHLGDRCRLALVWMPGSTDHDLLVLNVELDLQPEATLGEELLGDANALRVPDADDPRAHDGVLLLRRRFLPAAVATVSRDGTSGPWPVSLAAQGAHASIRKRSVSRRCAPRRAHARHDRA